MVGIQVGAEGGRLALHRFGGSAAERYSLIWVKGETQGLNIPYLALFESASFWMDLARPY
jgi:hypothetical protein